MEVPSVQGTDETHRCGDSLGSSTRQGLRQKEE
jgi:hypothetical protein